MNMVLINDSEAAGDGSVVLSDRRYAHIVKVLKLKAGDSFRIGIRDGVTGTARITAVTDSAVEAMCSFNEAKVDEVNIDILLAMPRPKVMKRLWAPLAMLGVGRIFIINAEKVEKYYFDTHVLDEDFYTPLIVDGLEQACGTFMPRVSIARAVTPESESFFIQFNGLSKVLA